MEHSFFKVFLAYCISLHFIIPQLYFLFHGLPACCWMKLNEGTRTRRQRMKYQYLDIGLVYSAITDNTNWIAKGHTRSSTWDSAGGHFGHFFVNLMWLWSLNKTKQTWFYARKFAKSHFKVKADHNIWSKPIISLELIEYVAKQLFGKFSEFHEYMCSCV